MRIDKKARELYPDETIDYDEMADDVFNQVNSDEYQEPIFDQSKDFIEPDEPEETSLMGVPSYDMEDEYVGDSKIDLAYMDAFDVPDEPTGFMGTHRAQSIKTQRSDPEVKERLQDYGQEYYRRPEIKENVREYMRGYEQREYVKAKRQAYYKRPEVMQRTHLRLLDQSQEKYDKRLGVRKRRMGRVKRRENVSKKDMNEIEDFFGVGIL